MQRRAHFAEHHLPPPHRKRAMRRSSLSAEAPGSPPCAARLPMYEREATHLGDTTLDRYLERRLATSPHSRAPCWLIDCNSLCPTNRSLQKHLPSYLATAPSLAHASITQASHRTDPWSCPHPAQVKNQHSRTARESTSSSPKRYRWYPPTADPYLSPQQSMPRNTTPRAFSPTVSGGRRVLESMHNRPGHGIRNT